MIIFEFLVKIRKWVCIGLYRSPSQNENYYLDILSEVLINKPTCFQSANPTCIDLILANKKRLFKN